MVADALAYWSCVRQPLGLGRAPVWDISAESPTDWMSAALLDARSLELPTLVQWASETPAYRARGRGPFQHRLMVFADSQVVAAGWLDDHGPVPLPPLDASLAPVLCDLQRWLTALLLAARNEFFVLHGVTSLYALRHCLGALSSADARALLAHWCRAAVATLIGQGLPGLDALPAVLERYPDHASPVDEAEWRSLREASWASHDEHVPKAVYALNQWARADVDQGDRYRAAAQTLVAPHPSGDPGEHLWFGPPQVVGGNGP